jgi:hypothetical protein
MVRDFVDLRWPFDFLKKLVVLDVKIFESEIFKVKTKNFYLEQKLKNILIFFSVRQQRCSSLYYRRHS